MNLSVQRLPHAKDLPLPAYATEGSAALDLLAAIDGDIELKPGTRAAIPCGIAVDNGEAPNLSDNHNVWNNSGSDGSFGVSSPILTLSRAAFRARA